MASVIFYEEDDLFKYLPGDYPKEPSPDINKALLNRTRKRLERWGLKTRLKKSDVYKVHIDSKKLSELILDTLEDASRLFFEPCFILMGQEQFMDLIGDPDLPPDGMVGTYQCPVDLMRNEKRIYGVEIKVVPYFDGMALIPKKMLE